MTKTTKTLAQLHAEYKAAEGAWRTAMAAAIAGAAAGSAVDMGTPGVRGTVVQNKTRTTDYRVAQELLTVPRLRSVLKDPAIDPDKVADAVRAGKISQDVADMIVKIKPSAPFIKVTR